MIMPDIVFVRQNLCQQIDYKYQKLAIGGKNSENAASQIDSWNKNK